MTRTPRRFAGIEQKAEALDFIWTEEQDELRRVVRRFLEAKMSEGVVRATMATREGFDRVLWRQTASDLGLQGLTIPTEHGGSGYTAKEVAVVMQEFGRSVACLPFLSTAVFAVNTLLQSGDEDAKSALLPRIAAGEIVVAVAYVEENHRFEESGITAVAEEHAGGYRLSGTKSYVIDGLSADTVLVAARTAHGVSLFVVDGQADGVRRHHLSTLDQTRKQARLEFANTPGRILGADGSGWAVLEAAIDRTVVAMASEQVGAAERCLEMAVEYAKVREQFGRPIGSFMAIKHKCADVAVEIELSRAAEMYAASRVMENSPEIASAASVAKAFCSDAFLKAAKENIQIHGGIGYTWEHPAHLYLKRAKSDQVLFGGGSYHRRRVADLVGL